MKRKQDEKMETKIKREYLETKQKVCSLQFRHIQRDTAPIELNLLR